MENLKEIAEALRRVSQASSIKSEGIRKKKLSTKQPPPRDSYSMVKVLFLLIGIVNIVPLTFFSTAYNYWMYKFRDTSSEEVDLNNKTTLQVYFASGTMIFQSLPGVTCMLLSTVFGHKLNLRSRIIFTSAIIVCLFAFFTLMIEVNTDTWQTGFFVLTLTGLSMISGVNTLFQVSTLTLLSKFPPEYMRPFLLGQGISGIFNGCLQLIALAVATSVKTSAMIYFVTGTLLIFITWSLYVGMKYSDFYQYYIENGLVEERTQMITRREILETLKKIWPCISIIVITMVNLIFIHPAVTSLIVSENYGNGDAWSDTYFIPTITYLFNDVCGLVGRAMVTRGWITHKTKYYWVIGTLLKLFVITPFLMLCNAQPRNHLPVWFTHDWQYILILTVFSVTNGLLFNLIFLSLPVLAPGEEEAAYSIMMCTFSLSGGISSPLSLLGIHLL